MRHLTVLALAALFALPACKDEVSGAAPDNTARNERDRDGANPTPLDQKNNENDLRIARDIRKALLEDDQLSLNAHNAKVISSDGVVTLRGPVESSAERSTVEGIAKAAAGVTRVDNQLEVKAP
jgi:osmotically-inducible protein OsmY